MKPTILAIDDDPIILDMYEAVLDQTHNLHLVSSGQEALDFLKPHPRVDLILLDIMMPGIDGYETCQRIRENPFYSHVKVILVSSKVKLEERLWGYQVGADDYITKPFEASELLAKVKVFLRLKNAEEIDKIKTNFINLLNHEARTPLTAIFGYVTLLQQSPNLSAEEKHFVEQIYRCGKTLLRSSEKTVLLSDLKSGTIQSEQTKIPLNDFLVDCQHKFKTAADEKRLSLRVQSDTDQWIFGDAKLLGIAIDALLENAVQFAREDSVVEVIAKAVLDRIRVEVLNTGEKIPPERQQAIFDELAVQEIEHHHQGNGLSLAIARRIIETHDGALSVKNHDDGPVFTIELNSYSESC